VKLAQSSHLAAEGRPTRWAAAGATVALGLFLGGCQSGQSQAPALAAAPSQEVPVARVAIALPSEAALDGQQLVQEASGRRDPLLSVVPAPTLLASSKWPEDPKPIERPVRFTRWQQR